MLFGGVKGYLPQPVLFQEYWGEGRGGVGHQRAHIVVVVRGGGSTQNFIVALQEGLESALQPLQLLEHLNILRWGRMAVDNPKGSEQRLSLQSPPQSPEITCSVSPWPPKPFLN